MKQQVLGSYKLKFLPEGTGMLNAKEMQVFSLEGKLIQTLPVDTHIGPQTLLIPRGNPARIWSRDLAHKRPGKREMRGLLVVRAGGIGDLIILSSSLQALREKFPKERITLATKPEHICMFQGVPYLDDVVPVLDLERKWWRKVIDLRGATEPPELGLGFARGDWESYTTMDRSDVFDRLCGVSRLGKKKRFQIGIEKAFVNSYGIGIVISDTSPTRQIPPQYIKPLACLLRKEFGEPVLLLGKTNEHTRYLTRIGRRGMDVMNCLDIDSVQDFIIHCTGRKLLITPDSAAVHIGGAYGVETLALFGNIRPELRVKYYPTVTAMYSSARCGRWPCFEHPDHCRKTRHWKEGVACMKYFTPERIVAKVKEMMNAS